MFKQFFCNHDYEKINEFVTKSEFEQIKDRGLIPTTHSSNSKKYITDFKCKKCLKLKRLVVKS